MPQELRCVRYNALQRGAESDREDVAVGFLPNNVLIDVGILREIDP